MTWFMMKKINLGTILNFFVCLNIVVFAFSFQYDLKHNEKMMDVMICEKGGLYSEFDYNTFQYVTEFRNDTLGCSLGKKIEKIINFFPLFSGGVLIFAVFMRFYFIPHYLDKWVNIADKTKKSNTRNYKQKN